MKRYEQKLIGNMGSLDDLRNAIRRDAEYVMNCEHNCLGIEADKRLRILKRGLEKLNHRLRVFRSLCT